MIEKSNGYFEGSGWIYKMILELKKKNTEMLAKDKDLRTRIEKIAKKISFPINEIYKCDGSTRSSHSNAYFFGIFKKKRIVIFDTLIDQCSNDETDDALDQECISDKEIDNIIQKHTKDVEKKRPETVPVKNGRL